MKQTPYYDTFTEAVDSMQLALSDAKAEPFHNGQFGQPHWSEETLARGPVSYGATLFVDYELLTLNGKQTRKWFHASIHRMPSGRYELISYIL